MKFAHKETSYTGPDDPGTIITTTGSWDIVNGAVALTAEKGYKKEGLDKEQEMDNSGEDFDESSASFYYQITDGGLKGEICHYTDGPSVDHEYVLTKK